MVDAAQARLTNISKLGLGCSQVGSLGHISSMAQWRALMHRALDMGVTLFDTADIYGQGDSEREIGRVLAPRRDQTFVVTKIGKQFSGKMRLMRPLKPLLKPLLRASGAGQAVRAQRAGAMRADFSPAHLRPALDASLKRLGVSEVDALLLHGPPTEVYLDPMVGELLADVVKTGKARHVGASCETHADLVAALSIDCISIVQLPLDVFDAADQSGVLDGMIARGVIVLLREVIRGRPDLSPEQAVAAIAHRRGVDCVIAGTGRADHLAALVRACE